jgi:hypothetical protein
MPLPTHDYRMQSSAARKNCNFFAVIENLRRFLNLGRRGPARSDREKRIGLGVDMDENAAAKWLYKGTGGSRGNDRRLDGIIVRP